MLIYSITAATICTSSTAANIPTRFTQFFVFTSSITLNSFSLALTLPIAHIPTMIVIKLLESPNMCSNIPNFFLNIP